MNAAKIVMEKIHGNLMSMVFKLLAESVCFPTPNIRQVALMELPSTSALTI
jgi:hypothetical protein